MIPLSVLSQQKYIINSDTVVVFTMNETRKVAIELLKGDKYKQLYDIQTSVILEKDSLLNKYQFHNNRLETLLDESNIYCGTLTDENTNLQIDLDKSIKTTKKLFQVSSVSIILNIILLIICL